jgi:4-aminobutyrate aminotransferase-like enzyme
VRDVRGRGHLWGIELGDSDGRSGEDRARAIAADCLLAGVLVLQAGAMIRINPPLTIDDADLAAVCDALKAAVVRAS